MTEHDALDAVSEAQQRLGNGWKVSAVADGDSVWWQAERDEQRIQRARLDSLAFIAGLLDGRRMV